MSTHYSILLKSSYTLIIFSFTIFKRKAWCWFCLCHQKLFDDPQGQRTQENKEISWRKRSQRVTWTSKLPIEQSCSCPRHIWRVLIFLLVLFADYFCLFIITLLFYYLIRSLLHIINYWNPNNIVKGVVNLGS